MTAYSFWLSTPIFKFSNVRSPAFRRSLAEVLLPEGGTPNDWQIPEYLKIAVLNFVLVLVLLLIEEKSQCVCKNADATITEGSKIKGK
jgi:hypothetical protein